MISHMTGLHRYHMIINMTLKLFVMIVMRNPHIQEKPKFKVM